MPRVKDNRRLMKTLDDWLAHCEQLHPKTIDMGLDRVRAVAERMGLRFDCPVFTVAGTNGKGSTCAMLEAILTQARKGGRLVVTAENHTVIGGLGEAVAGILMREGVHPAFRMIGLPDQFLEAGALPTLHDMYGISVNGVAQQIKGWL